MYDYIPQVRFADLSLTQLVKVFNTLTPTAPVSKFSTVADARRRVGKRLMTAYPGSFISADGLVSLPHSVGFSHETLEFQVNGVEQPTPISVEADETFTGNAESAVTEPTPLASALGDRMVKTLKSKGGKRMFKDTQVISVLVANPKRPGSGSHNRFARYQTGMTVAEALAAGILPEDLVWDAGRNFITIA